MPQFLHRNRNIHSSFAARQSALRLLIIEAGDDAEDLLQRRDYAVYRKYHRARGADYATRGRTGEWMSK